MTERFAPRKSGGSSVKLYACGCGAMFLPADQLKQITGHTSVADGKPGKWEQARQCPACKTYMDALDFRGVRTDRCPGCSGLFLDPNELEQVARTKVPLQRAAWKDPVIPLPEPSDVDVQLDLMLQYLKTIRLRQPRWRRWRLR
ncbi:MAG: zf-TFIIB domain-containing protein [Myxococcaceae bacterium]